MLDTNPFSILAETVSPFAMQSFIIAMIVLIALGTIIQMIHHKNITYFFNNAKKAKLQATREIGAGERASIIAKTAVVDIGTTSELGFGKRRLSHGRATYSLSETLERGRASSCASPPSWPLVLCSLLVQLLLCVLYVEWEGVLLSSWSNLLQESVQQVQV